MARNIRLFQNIRKSHQKLGIHSPPSKSKRQNFLFNWKFLFNLLCVIALFTSQATFLMFKANSVPEYGTTFCGCTTALMGLFFYLTNLYQMENISKLIENCERFIEMRAHNSTSKFMYTQMNAKIECFTEIFFYMLDISICGLTCAVLLYCYVKYYIFDLKEESFILPVPIMFPFDWKTPLGYLFTVLALLAMYYSILLCSSRTLSFYASLCSLFITFAQDITNDLDHLNDGSESKRNHKKMRERLVSLIQHHSDVKEFVVREFNGIYKILTFSYFSWVYLSICTSLLVLQLQLSTSVNPIQLMVMLVQVPLTFLYLFGYCEFGERVTYAFNIFHENLCHCDWYAFPIEMQRIFLITLSGTQEPVFIQGYPNIICSRETYKTTVNSGFSYFTTLRRING